MSKDDIEYIFSSSLRSAEFSPGILDKDSTESHLSTLYASLVVGLVAGDVCLDGLCEGDLDLTMRAPWRAILRLAVPMAACESRSS